VNGVNLPRLARRAEAKRAVALGGD